MSLHGPSFQRILMANYNAPKWQGIKGVTIPDLHDEVEDHEVLTLFPQLLCMPMIYQLTYSWRRVTVVQVPPRP